MVQHIIVLELLVNEIVCDRLCLKIWAGLFIVSGQLIG